MTLPSASTVIATLMAFGLSLATTRRILTAAVFTVYLLGFVLLSSYIKQAYLGMAMTLADMYFFLLRPLENFRLFVSYSFLGYTLLGVLAGAVLLTWLGVKLERPLRLFAQPPRGWLWRAALALTVGGSGVGAAWLASPPPPARANDGDAWAAFQTMYVQQHPGGPMGRLNVFFDNRSFEATLPARRVQTRFSPAVSSVDDARRPDILLVLEESTFDVSLIRRCPREYCALEMFAPVPGAIRTQQGPLLVHTTGGGTWLAEFAVVSGFDWRVFGRGGAYAPVSLAPRLQRSLPSHLRALGYRTVAIYPTEGNFLSAATAYKQYGFEEFYARAELELPDEWNDVRDRLVFDRTLQLLARRVDTRPVFVFVLTIRNHGPHEGDAAKISPPFAAAAQALTPPMADFLARLHDSSADYVRLASTWLKSSRPRVIAWFGDHQPEAAWDFTRHPESLDRNRMANNVTDVLIPYLTYYQLSANFGTPEVATQPRALDLAYLGAELLNFAGLPLQAGDVAALQMVEGCNGLMLDCTNRDLVNDYLSFRIHDLLAVR